MACTHDRGPFDNAITEDTEDTEGTEGIQKELEPQIARIFAD